jgi:hypothetical protein
MSSAPGSRGPKPRSTNGSINASLALIELDQGVGGGGVGRFDRFGGSRVGWLLGFRGWR